MVASCSPPVPQPIAIFCPLQRRRQVPTGPRAVNRHGFGVIERRGAGTWGWIQRSSKIAGLVPPLGSAGWRGHWGLNIADQTCSRSAGGDGRAGKAGQGTGAQRGRTGQGHVLAAASRAADQLTPHTQPPPEPGARHPPAPLTTHALDEPHRARRGLPCLHAANRRHAHAWLGSRSPSTFSTTTAARVHRLHSHVRLSSLSIRHHTPKGNEGSTSHSPPTGRRSAALFVALSAHSLPAQRSNGGAMVFPNTAFLAKTTRIRPRVSGCCHQSFSGQRVSALVTLRLCP